MNAIVSRIIDNVPGLTASDLAGIDYNGLRILELSIDSDGASARFRDTVDNMADDALLLYALCPHLTKAESALCDLAIHRRGIESAYDEPRPE